MFRKYLALAASTAALALAASPATALTIVLKNTGGVEAGTNAWVGFTKAAKYWESVLTSNATVNLDVGVYSYGAAGANVLGSTRSYYTPTTVRDWENAVFTTGNSSLDSVVRRNLPATDANGAISMVTPGYNDAANKLGANARTRILDNDGSLNNVYMRMTNANAKALGFAVDNSANPDGAINFNSDFNFDYDPTNGITSGSYDFLDVAIHEIGHALGFTSGVDLYDLIATPNGLSQYANYDANNGDAFGAALDMFRYSSNPEGLGGGGPQLDWSIHNPNTDGANFTNPYFSIDGGNTMFENGYFARGQRNGASYQASHWRGAAQTNPTVGYVGVMNPYGTSDATVTAVDLAAFDAIGWNTNVDVLKNGNYKVSMDEIFRAFPLSVPETSTWIQMIFGFSLLGGVLRANARRKIRSVHA